MPRNRNSEEVSYPPLVGAGPGLAQLREELTRRSEWRGELVSPQKLAQLADDLGFGRFSEDDIRGLWHVGLLRADYVENKSNEERLANLVQLEDGSQYLDVRIMQPRPEGYGSTMPTQNWGEASREDPAWELLFHPYRVYVLHHLVRTLVSRTSNCQYLLWKPGVESIAKHELEGFDRWTSSPAFSDRFDYWNQLAELAAICTPIRWLPPNDRNASKSQVSWLWQYALTLRDHLHRSGLRFIDECRRDLAWAAHTRDSNDKLHTLIRLMRDSERDRISGRLGSAMKFRSMAESIRRACERLLPIELPEEDELGPGTWMDGARKMLYGHERVFDASRSDLRDFLGILGLDFAVKVRCYVEGETELGAFRHAVGVEGQCSIVNLKGDVVQRGGKGMSFADSLAEDIRNRVISVVVVDADRADVVRTVRRAASEKRMHGPFFLSKPDFEFANFSVEELSRIAAALRMRARVSDVEVSERLPDILQVVSKARSGKEFLDQLPNAGLNGIGKGEKWGEALMAYAIEHQEFPGGHPRAGQEREIVNIARTLIRAQDVGYLRSVQYEKVDPNTGRMVSRQRQPAENTPSE